MKEEPKKSKRPPNQFDFCPKHKVFYRSCGCDWRKKIKQEDITEVVDIPSQSTPE